MSIYGAKKGPPRQTWDHLRTILSDEIFRIITISDWVGPVNGSMISDSIKSGTIFFWGRMAEMSWFPGSDSDRRELGEFMIGLVREISVG